MPDINVGSEAQTMFNMIDNAINSVKLSWDYSMVGKKNSLLTKIENA